MEKNDKKDLESKIDELMRDALKSNDISELEDLAEILESMASSISKMKFYDEALAYYKRFLDIKRHISPVIDHKIADALESIGNIYSNKKNYEEALIHYNEALVHYKQVESNKDIESIHFSIGVCLENQEKYAEALKAYSESAEINRLLLDLKGQQDIHKILSKIGCIYNKPVTYCETLVFNEWKDKTLELYFDHSNIADNLFCIGKMHYKLGDCNNALRCLKQAREEEMKSEKKNESIVEYIRNEADKVFKKMMSDFDE